MTTANGTAIAGGAIVAALVDMLVTKGVLAKADVGILINNASYRLAPFGQSADILAARETISSIAAMYSRSDR